MSNIVLVTGATGTLGSEIVKILAEARVKVRAAVKTKDKSWKIPAVGVEVVEINMEVPETLSAAFVDVEKLILITPFNEKMVEYTKNLVNAAKKSGVKHIVKISALGADPNANMIFAKLHGEAEQIIVNSGINWTFLRPNMFMQYFLSMHGDNIRNKKSFYAPAARGKTSFVDARDVAECAASVTLMNGYEGNTYTLTGPEAMDHRGFEHILSGVTGDLIKYYPIEEEEFVQTMKSSGMSDWNISAFSELFRAMRDEQLAALTDDVRLLTGKRARSLTQFSNDYRKEFKAK